MTLFRFIVGFPAALVAACAATTTERLGLPPLETVPQVDLSRYVGTWYEIASFPQRFQKGCTGTTANYTLQENGEIRVFNRCRKGSLQGEEDSAEGRARVTDPATNAKLEVTFFWPFWGAYWIIDLDPDYQFAVVGHPGRDYLWILSRTPTMEEEVYEDIIERLRKKRYQVEKLQKTLQPPTEPVQAAPREG
jgi:apolipoprotein D and lipocalin family protein